MKVRFRDEERRKARLFAVVLKEQVYEKLGHACCRCGFSDGLFK